MSEPNVSNTTSTAVKDVFDLAENAAKAATNAAGEVVGAAGDAGQAVIGEIEGVGSLTVKQAGDLVAKLLGHLRAAAGV